MKRIVIAAALLLVACGRNEPGGGDANAPVAPDAPASLAARDPASEMGICQARFPGERHLCECMQNAISAEDFSLMMRIAEAELPAPTWPEKAQAREAAINRLAPAFGGVPQLRAYIGRIQQQVRAAC
ncbi:MAG: hypothetical protein AB7J28_08285 [Hyphomonadaceae bacterium]